MKSPGTKSNSGSRYLVVIPARNEAETIREVVTRALKHADVSVTDDNSKDATPQILARIQMKQSAGITRTVSTS